MKDETVLFGLTFKQMAFIDLTFFITVSIFSICLFLGFRPWVLVIHLSVCCFLYGVWKWHEFWEEQWIKDLCPAIAAYHGLALGLPVWFFTGSLKNATAYVILMFFLGIVTMFIGAYMGRKYNITRNFTRSD